MIRPVSQRSAQWPPVIIAVLCLLLALFSDASVRAQSFGTYTDLHDFGGTVVNANGTSGPDGIGPTTNVVFDSAGNMYGTAPSGGPNRSAALPFGNTGGMVWEITASGQYKDLHDFGSNIGGGSDGWGPSSNVVIDSAGNLYGTTATSDSFPLGNGDYAGPGTIWEITTSGDYKILHYFNQSGTGGSGGTGVTLDTAGNLYGTGASVWELTPSRQYLDLHDFGGTVTIANGLRGPDGDNSIAGVAFDSSGNMYGTTQGGGPHGVGIVWEILVTGGYKDLHDFGRTVTNANGASGPDGQDPWAGVTLDQDGDLYGATTGGGPSGAGMIWEITASGTYKDLHDFGYTATTPDGAIVADGVSPWADATFDSVGNMYGTASDVVWGITASGDYLVLHSFGSISTNAAGATVVDGNLSKASVAFDPSGSMFGTTSLGGPNADGIVWELAAGGSPGEPAPAPTVNPGSEVFHGSVNVSITDTLSTAIILYTTDETDPTTSSTAHMYTAPFTVASNDIVNAVATASGYADSRVATATFTEGAPAAPSGLKAIAGNAQVVVFWDVDADATSYNVYRSTTSGGEGAAVYQSGLTLPSLVDTGLTNGTAYYYKVAAVSSLGTSARSLEVAVTPEPPPPPPTLTVTAVGSYPPFSGTSGASVANPAYIMQGSDGNLYGTTYYGGTSNLGTLFEMTLGGAVTVLHSFAGGSGGANPSATPLQTGDGTLIGTTIGQVTSGFVAFGPSVYSLSSTGQFNNYASMAQPQNSQLTYGVAGIYGELYIIEDGYASGNLSDTNNPEVFDEALGGGNSSFSTELNGSAFPGAPGGIISATDGNYYGFDQMQVFKITPIVSVGVPLSHLYEFTGPDGSLVTSLIQGYDGNFYGTTAEGGEGPGVASVGGGTVFSITPTGTFTKLHYFPTGTDPSGPGGLVQGADGNFYGFAAGTGGAGDYGDLFQMTPSGTVTPLYSFGNNDAIGNTVVSFIGASDGSFYGTTEFGGPNGTGVVFHVVVNPAAAPPAPTGLTATGGNAQVTLSWNASPGATSYSIYRSTTAGGEGTSAYQTDLTRVSFTDTELTNGTTYYYTVAAVNSIGTSAQSAEASATPELTPPAAPSGVVAIAGNALVALSWDVDAGATSYSVYRSTTSGGEGTTAYQEGLTQPSFTDTGLTNGTTYYYAVAAVGVHGTSSPSAEVSATPSGSAPPPPPPSNIVETFSSGLQMISAPVDDSAFTLSQIFDVANVKMAVWNPSTLAYVISPTSPADTIVPGQGYWVRFPTTADLLVAGPEADPTQAITVSLSPGWNMIGDPRIVAVPMSGVTFSTGSSGSISVGAAVGSGLFGSVVYTYQSGDTNYTSQSTAGATLDAFYGYWIYASQACTLTFPAS